MEGLLLAKCIGVACMWGCIGFTMYKKVSLNNNAVVIIAIIATVAIIA